MKTEIATTEKRPVGKPPTKPEVIIAHGQRLYDFVKANPEVRFILEYAVEAGICRSTLSEWKARNEEYAELYKKAQDILELRTLKDVYNPERSVPAMFFAKSVFGYRDRSIIQGDGDINIQINVNYS